MQSMLKLPTALLFRKCDKAKTGKLPLRCPCLTECKFLNTQSTKSTFWTPYNSYSFIKALCSMEKRRAKSVYHIQTSSYSRALTRRKNLKQFVSSCYLVTSHNNFSLQMPSLASTLYEHTRSFWSFHKKRDFGDYAVIDRVGEVCKSCSVPAYIQYPPYADTGKPTQGPSGPEVKASWQVDSVRESCRIARSILNAVEENLKVGMTTEAIDAMLHQRIIDCGAYPSPLNYHGFPKSVCTSVNNVACHGIPDDRRLVNGDIISVDVTVYYNGYHGDCCETYLIGNVDDCGRHLVRAAKRCRDEAISICRPGMPFSAIGAKIEEIAKEEKITVVPCFVGHGIGKYFHGPPDIYHCYNDYPGTMEEGMTFTIEPIVAQGSEEVLILEDGWTAVMLDNGRAAQFEHTIHITKSAHEILTDYC
ncbi:Methionine aminopeptidase 1D, mitochondrial [Halocaridina rubra]|uniref:Methionine aminopeptidase n=1 Tax=Halocaridina rubra TaxID=373956 RepID=A0AAN9A0E9_HALRR